MSPVKEGYPTHVIHLRTERGRGEVAGLYTQRKDKGCVPETVNKRWATTAILEEEKKTDPKFTV